MLDALIDSPGLFTAILVALTLVSYLTGLLTLTEFSRQHVLERSSSPAPGIVGKVRTNAGQSALAQTVPVFLIFSMLFMDRVAREFLGGGVLVLQVAAIASNLTEVLTLRSIRMPGATEGQLRYSAAHQYRGTAARLLGSSLFTGVVAVLFNSDGFGFGGALLLATAIGYYRRARQMDSGTEAVQRVQ